MYKTSITKVPYEEPLIMSAIAYAVKATPIVDGTLCLRYGAFIR